ncbi:MAG: leucine-rich repeat domain-containing protein, partial [Paludibacteraceae bacterium]|nr:leucine-rich repeat domain-containing protein [Paludibacteraceae bacterium]
GEYNLCLRWYNDGSIGEMPIAVDNMAITTPLNTTEYPLTYVLNEDGTATVVKCATDYSGNVSIPTVVTYNGTTYTVTSISENAFKECGYLTSVTIPNSVTSIGRMAFAYCWSLESVTLSENISSIEDRTFYDCESLTSITLPNNVTYVGENAFGYCYNLSAVTFGNNVTTIDNYAFAYCWSLESVTIPASVSYIGYSTFVSCNSLNSIVVESGNTTYDSRNNCNAIIETASNTLITGCQSTIIPETVTTIGDEAFYNCDGLTTIAIPNSVTSIGYYAFANCDNLSSVDLGNGVTTISGSAFEYCYAMTSVTIPASVTEIGSWAFYNCHTIVMEGTTPPTISSSTFKSEATIFVPCTALDTYLATSVWQDLNLQGSNYTVILSATEGGYAQITASDCATNTVTIEAYPEERYVFTQWSDGNTDNPRILTLTEDIALTAEFTTLTYPVTNLVVTTNCGTAYASWESDAPWFEVAAFDANGDYVLYDIVTYKVGVSNSQPFADGEYTWQVTPMYSDIEGDYAGDAVQAPFTISADNCVDLEIYDLSYTITDETTVNLIWNSEASAYYVRLYDYQGNYLVNELIYTNSFTYTLPDMGRYWFEIQGYNEDLTQYSSWQNISFDIVYSNWEYDLNFVYGEQGDNGPWNDAYQRPILLYSEDYQTVMRIYPMPKYENSIIGTYFVENNTDNLYAGGMWGDGSYITYNGISTGAIQSGMVTIARNEENKFVVSFDLTDANGINYTNTCTIENMSGSNITDDNVTALSASQALTLTQNLPDHDLTTMPYMVNGVISRITSYDVNLYSRARFYISEDGSTTNEFYCYNTSWLNNTSFTTGDEIAEGDTVVIYGNLQNYQGTTPEIKGYVYQHFAKEVDESCYILTVDATEGGYVSISPLAECYEAGTQVVITATPNENYEFVTWSDGNTSAQRTIVMDKDYNLTATFRSTSIPTNNYTLTLTCDKGGTVGKDPNYEYYEENTTVTIFANANEGYK